MDVTVTTIAGTVHTLGPVALTTTVREVKHKLAQVSDMSVGSQTLFHRGVKGEGNVDWRLGDSETMGQVRQYRKNGDGGGEVGAGGGAGEVLQLYVLLGTAVDDAYKWVRDMDAGNKALSARIGDGTAGHGDHQLNKPHGIATVPAHPHLMVVTVFSSHQVRVYDTRGGGSGSSRLVCKMGKEDGNKGWGEGEFNAPWSVAVTEDSAFVIVSEYEGNRLQVLSLVVNVNVDGTTAELGFVQAIGEGQLQGPRGLALRSVGGVQTVLVAEGGCGTDHRVTEWGVDDGLLVRIIGKKGSGDGELSCPIDVAVLPAPGQIAIADCWNHRVCIFDGESGTFVRAFGSQGKEEDGHFYYPTAIAADSHGHVLVLDDFTDRLQVLGRDGTHLCTRNDLGITVDSHKGLEWWVAGGGWRLAIANNMGNNALVFGSA